MTSLEATRRTRAIDWLTAGVVVVTTAVVSTWPLATSPWAVPQHQDPLFSAWRLYQWSRTLAGESSGLFDGNIFHPASDVQLFSDPMVLPSLLAVPWIRMGVPVAVVYAGMFWLAASTAGLAMFACARRLSGSRGGALVAAAVFVGSPIRLEQIVHLEMLWTACLPLTVLATMRLFDGERRGPWALGAALIGQMLCCIYYGVYLFTLWPVLAGVEWLRRGRALPPRAVQQAVAAVFVAGLAVAVYALPFQRVRAQVGDRPAPEIGGYSATLGSYASASALSRVWGWTTTGGPETRLFPGLTGVVLAVAGATAVTTPWVAAVTVTTLVAIDASRGINGWTYPLFATLPPYKGLRVPARFGMLALTGLSLLAAVGCTRLTRAWSSRAMTAAGAIVIALAVAESSSALSVRELPKAAPPVYALLSTLTPTVIAHLPLPDAGALPGADPEHQYFAQHHRHEIVNGYSGFYPPSYLQLLAETRTFPDTPSLAAFRAAGVEYLLLHAQFYQTRQAFEAVAAALEHRHDVDPIATSSDDGGPVRVYRLRR